jgi:hypothetical protein
MTVVSALGAGLLPQLLLAQPVHVIDDQDFHLICCG